MIAGSSGGGKKRRGGSSPGTPAPAHSRSLKKRMRKIMTYVVKYQDP